MGLAALLAGWLAFAVWSTGVSSGERNRAVLTSAEGACVWRAAPSPDPRPGFVDSLASVAAVSLRRAWAVGDYFTGQEAGPQGAFIERWDGRSWRVVPAPGLRDATLGSVSASGADDVWAVGDAADGGQLFEHWDGSRWRIVPAPSERESSVFAVAARAPGDAWAVGVRGNGVVHTLIEHWDGRRWSVVRSPSPPGAHGTGPFAGLRGVTAISANDAWAAGESGGSARAPATRTLIEHWDGRRWTIVPSPNVRFARGVINDMLSGISASQPNEAWAVGLWGTRPRVSGSTGDHSLVLHWNGRSWSRVQTPAVAHRSSLQAVATTGERAWAVGDRGFPARTLIERWDRERWTITPSPHGLWLGSIAAVSSGPVWAVGQTGHKPLAAHCGSKTPVSAQPAQP